MTRADIILEHLLDAVLVVDGNGIVVYANRAACDLFQRKAENLVGEDFGIATEVGAVQDICLFRNGKLHTAEMLVTTIEWNDAPAALLSLRDITVAKESHLELLRQRRELERSNEENAQYAALASHDLREPVRKILVYAGLLLDVDSLGEVERKRVKTIHGAADRMRRLIDGIARLSKVGHNRLPFEPVDLGLIVRDVRADLEVSLQEKNGRIEVVGKLPTIDAVPGEMYQLLLNLVANALKYSRPGVAPLVLIEEAPADEDICCITCTDNGMGFPADIGPRLFQPFKRLHSSDIEGMGVGLALCQKIIDAHHGSIRAEGREGEGATFTICLPRQQSPPPTTENDPASAGRNR
jgi:light-regulated signal transduction histidine kinase (bacteriophytochrome)